MNGNRYIFAGMARSYTPMALQADLQERAMPAKFDSIPPGVGKICRRPWHATDKRKSKFHEIRGLWIAATMA
jgi:hypothetical protein